jgi:hypothetical protein
MPQVISSPPDHAARPGSQRNAQNPEFELLRACCIAARNDDESASIESRLSRPILWNVFLELAEFHNVEPLVSVGLLKFRELLPSDVAADLERRFALNARKNLRLTHELLRILACLARRGVEAIPLKGPILAQTVYGDVALRQFSDLDILIRARDYGHAAEAVPELGYTPSSMLRPAIEREWLQTGYERAFDGPLGKNLVELQWQLMPRFYVMDVDVEELFRRAGTLCVAEQEVTTLDAEDLFIVVCAHASKHAWMRLGWICDIAGLVRSQRIDYGVVRGRAAVLGVQRIVDVSVQLANQMLASPIPAEFCHAMEVLAVKKLTARVSKIVVQSADYNAESVEYFQLMLALRERHRHKFAWRLLFTPSVGEWDAIALPEWLFPLYRVVRMGRLLKRTANVLKT